MFSFISLEAPTNWIEQRFWACNIVISNEIIKLLKIYVNSIIQQHLFFSWKVRALVFELTYFNSVANEWPLNKNFLPKTFKKPSLARKPNPITTFIHSFMFSLFVWRVSHHRSSLIVWRIHVIEKKNKGP